MYLLVYVCKQDQKVKVLYAEKIKTPSRSRANKRAAATEQIKY
jgi:hypothetical protein